jgi:hypothetical protein
VTSPFTNMAPNVSFFSKDWQATRSVRGNLQWNGPVANGRYTANVDLTYSRNLNQPGNYDLNFAGASKFNLASEGGRPVYVPVSSIDPASGLAAPRASRLHPEYNAVNEARSDLTSESKQLSIRLSPMTFNSKLGWNLGYVYADVREQYRGFQSTTADPRAVAWSRSAAAAKHQLQYSLNYNFFDAVRVNWFGNVRAGTSYTPGVAGDVNGDGPRRGARQCDAVAPQQLDRRRQALPRVAARPPGRPQQLPGAVDAHRVPEHLVQPHQAAPPAAGQHPVPGEQPDWRRRPAPARRGQPARLGADGAARCHAAVRARLQPGHAALHV